MGAILPDVDQFVLKFSEVATQVGSSNFVVGLLPDADFFYTSKVLNTVSRNCKDCDLELAQMINNTSIQQNGNLFN